MTESYDEAMEVVRTVEAIKAAHGDSSTVLSVKSVYSALPQDQDAKLALIADIRALARPGRGPVQRERAG